MNIQELQTQLNSTTNFNSFPNKEEFVLMFSGTFTSEQKNMLRQFWLVVPSNEELESVNSQLSKIQISPIETISGQKVVSIDLLTEKEIRDIEIICNWQIVKLNSETDFPQPEEELL
jgi:hypothetical protein